jgi:hypothetical protein
MIMVYLGRRLSTTGRKGRILSAMSGDIQMERMKRMKVLKNGVSYYTKGKAIISVNFPEDLTVCQWCPYCRNEDSLKRWRCLLTGEYLVYPFVSVGNDCPVVLEVAKDQ